MVELRRIFSQAKVIAVVGLSDKPERPSYQVARYLLSQGFTILPINPLIATWLDQKAYPTIRAIPHTIQVDIVDIFRNSDAVYSIVEEIISTGRTPVIWMQEGVINESAKSLAQVHGLNVFMDTCIMKVHRSLIEDPLVRASQLPTLRNHDQDAS